jgi:hypothetical protein
MDQDLFWKRFIPCLELIFTEEDNSIINKDLCLSKSAKASN